MNKLDESIKKPLQFLRGFLFYILEDVETKMINYLLAFCSGKSYKLAIVGVE